MNTARRALLVVLAVLSTLAVSGCKDKGSSGGPDSFKVFDMEGRKKAWQGAWAVPYRFAMSGGSWSALEISGDKAKVSADGAADLEMAVTYDSPCSIGLVNKKADGSTETWNVGYVLKDGQIWAGLGGAGAVKDKVAASCDHPWGVYVLGANGKCMLWKQEMFHDKWQGEAAECGFRKAKPGTDTSWITDDTSNPEVFAWKPPVGDGEESLKQVGDVLIDEQLFGEHSEKAADFAAAKALVATKNSK
jgi:hypothetical protein